MAGRDARPDRAEGDPVLVDPPGHDRARRGERVAEARPDDPLLQVRRLAVRVDAAEPGDEVRVDGASTPREASTRTSPTRSRSRSSGAEV